MEESREERKRGDPYTWGGVAYRTVSEKRKHICIILAPLIILSQPRRR
jgi:hypothetical protein